MSGDWEELSDEALGHRLGAELPRYGAPPSVRLAVFESTRPRRPRNRWFAPTLSALATAMAFGLFLLPSLPTSTARDPVERLVGAVVAEHTRALMWGARRPDIIPAALPWLTQESGIGLAKAFLGDERLQFLGAEPVYLDWRRGMALHYQDDQQHHMTYVALPAPGMPLPETYRMQVDRFRPAFVRFGGFGTWLWKHGDLACFLISDLVSETDLDSFKDYFLRIRAATEPFPAS